MLTKLVEKMIGLGQKSKKSLNLFIFAASILM